jgi:hypothetical protein
MVCFNFVHAHTTSKPQEQQQKSFLSVPQTPLLATTMRFFLRLHRDLELPKTSDTSTNMSFQPQASHRRPTCSLWTNCWKCLRRYVCTSGWYPFIVAWIVTSGFVFSLYSSSGCQYIDIHVGFTPNNVAWNESRAELGLFYYHNPSGTDTSSFETSNDLFYEGCIWYTDTFQEKVIDRDRTWRVSRIMAMIAVCSSLLVTLTVWMTVLTPMPTGCIWPGLLLPTTMLSFIAEGSKFLLFDIALCREEVWFPSGVDSLPEVAQSCKLGSSAFFGIAAGVMHLLSLICIFIKSPKKRTLDASYGIYSNSADMNNIARSYIFRNDYRDDPRTSNKNVSLAQDPSLLDDDIYTEGPSPANNSLILKTNDNHVQDNTSQEEDDSSEPIHIDDPPFLPKKSDVSAAADIATSDVPPPRISESRIAVLSKLDLSNSKSVEVEQQQQRMIEDLLNELDTSLADERYDSN